jgi:hypothetical protein
VCTHPCVTRYAGYTVCNKNCDQSLNIVFIDTLSLPAQCVYSSVIMTMRNTPIPKYRGYIQRESIFISFVLWSTYISNFILGDINYIFRSERLLFNIKWAIFQLYYDEKKTYIFMRWWCPLCTRPTGDWHS